MKDKNEKQNTNEEKERKTTQDLFELYPAVYIEEEETDWGEPVGEEEW